MVVAVAATAVAAAADAKQYSYRNARHLPGIFFSLKIFLKTVDTPLQFSVLQMFAGIVAVRHNLCVCNSKSIFMERMNRQMPSDENRPMEYDAANDRLTGMTDLEKLVDKLEKEGYTDQYRVEGGKLHDLTNNKKYKPKDVKAVNFYRFEGISNPDDMSILYAIETSDGRKGTLADAYGMYSDDETGEFLNQIEVTKKKV